jgi:hypothetical protein
VHEGSADCLLLHNKDFELKLPDTWTWENGLVSFIQYLSFGIHLETHVNWSRPIPLEWIHSQKISRDLRFLFADSFVRCSVPIQFSLEKEDDQNHRRKLRRASFDCVKPRSMDSFIITENTAIISVNITITVTLITREKRRIVTRLLRSGIRSCRSCLTARSSYRRRSTSSDSVTLWHGRDYVRCAVTIQLFLDKSVLTMVSYSMIEKLWAYFS